MAELLQGALLPAGQVRFVLSNAGHIAGIVNPPNPKSVHRVVEGDAPLPADPDAWLAAATTHPTTWWEDWAGWIGPAPAACASHPGPGAANTGRWAMPPGTYVLER